MLSWFRRYGRVALAIVAAIAVFGPMFMTIANKAPNYEPTQRPSIVAKTASDPYMNIQAPKPPSFEVKAESCTVQFVGAMTEKSGSICTVTIDRSLYPYVSGTGSSCLDIDLTRAENFKPETHRWVILLKNSAEFTFLPVPKALPGSQMGSDPTTEFRGTVKGSHGEGTVPCGMLPAK